MFQNYLKITFRNLLRQKSYAGINLAGMAVGMAACFLILIYVNNELHYDEFHPTGERLYRVSYHANFSSSNMELSRIPAPIGPMMKENFPQVEQVARLYPRSISLREPVSDQQFEMERALFADSTAQGVFGFEFLDGNPATALQRPFSLVLTDKTARLVFGKKEAMGKSLLLANQGPFTVTGVVKAFPENAHLQFDLLASYQNMVDVEPPHAREAVQNVLTSNWIASHSHTYVLLKKDASPTAVDTAFPAFLKRFGNPDFVEKQAFTLFPVPEIHLRSAAADEPVPPANPDYLRLFSVIGALILLIACINFINLSTAIYLGRMKEVGVRKVLGAGRQSLIQQFIGETLLLNFVSFLLAWALVNLSLPYFGGVMGKTLTFNPLEDWKLALVFVAIFLVSGILAGSYPAFFASRFKPAAIFQSKVGHTGGGGNQWLRKGLITAQFVVGIALVSGTVVILAQLDYWRSLPLGFSHEQVISVPLSSTNMNAVFAPGDSLLRQRMNSFEAHLLQNPNVEAVTLASSLPGFGAARHPITSEKVTREDNVFLPALSVDYDMAETFGLQTVAGRGFGKEYGSDHIDAFIINEMAVKTLGWDSPEQAIGGKLTRGGKEGKVVGVVKDFHTASLQAALEPVIMEVSPGMFTTFAIRLKNAELPATISFVEDAWRQFFPEKSFEYSFLDESLQNGYAEENRLAKLTANFSIIAIFLSCFGLFGLISQTVQQRAKEIGIRKVLGANTAGLVGLLSKDFLKLVFVALVIASPVAYYFMDKWLMDFAYRIQIPWWVFVLAGGLAMAVAFLTVSVQSAKAALANPVKSLRSE